LLPLRTYHSVCIIVGNFGNIKKANVLIHMISFATVLLEIYFKGKYKEAIGRRKRRKRGEGRGHRKTSKSECSTRQQDHEDEAGQGHRAP
jgi:hypothetical protein